MAEIWGLLDEAQVGLFVIQVVIGNLFEVVLEVEFFARPSNSKSPQVVRVVLLFEQEVLSPVAVLLWRARVFFSLQRRVLEDVVPELTGSNLALLKIFVLVRGGVIDRLSLVAPLSRGFWLLVLLMDILSLTKEVVGVTLAFLCEMREVSFGVLVNFVCVGVGLVVELRGVLVGVIVVV